MISFALILRRFSWPFGEAVEASAVANHAKHLEEAKKEIENVAHVSSAYLYGSQSLFNDISKAIEAELSCCRFYMELHQRLATSPVSTPINEWVFTKQKDIQTEGWNKSRGDRWTKTNGRVKATIEIERGAAGAPTTKVRLTYRNDSNVLNFYKYEVPRFGGASENLTAHIRTEKSLDEKVYFFKNAADRFLENHLIPRLDTFELESASKLLSILSIPVLKAG